MKIKKMEEKRRGKRKERKGKKDRRGKIVAERAREREKERKNKILKIDLFIIFNKLARK